MRLKKPILYVLLYKVIVILLSGLLLIFESIVVNIISFFLLIIGSMLLVRFDILHPFTWFGGAYLLYSMSYPILYLMESKYSQIGISKELFVIQWLAYIVFFLVVTSNNKTYALKKIRKDLIGTKLIYFIAYLIVLLATINLYGGDHTTKREIEESIIIFLGFRMALVLLIVYSIMIINKVGDTLRSKVPLITTTFLILVLIFLFSGERDLVYRFLVLTFFITYTFSNQRDRRKFYYAILPTIIFLIPVINYFKYFGVTGEVRVSQGSIIEDFFAADFLSASRNIQMLINNEHLWEPFNGYTFFIGIMRGLEPPFINLINFSLVEWYNKTFFNEGRAGQGFTLVGEGYVNFGYLGIILLFIIIALTINFLYSKSNLNIYYFIIYILSVPTFIYAIRGDLANVMSPLISHIFTTVLLVALINYLSKNILPIRKVDGKPEKHF